MLIAARSSQDFASAHARPQERARNRFGLPPPFLSCCHSRHRFANAAGRSLQQYLECNVKVTAGVFLHQPGPTKPRHNPLKKRLTSRSFLRVALRRCLLSRVQRPCLKLPFRAPDGPPEPLAPPCIRQRARPLTAACRHGEPVLVLAPQRGALAKFASRRSMSA